MKSYRDLQQKIDATSAKNFIKYCNLDEKIEIEDSLKSDIEKLNNNLNYIEHDDPIIFIGMGTCGLASGAEKVKEAIEKELEKNDLKATIVSTGCIGYCAKEVIVDIKLPQKDRIAYCEVTVKDVPQLIKMIGSSCSM
jgi:(2Fe-2S) ferredoxin